MPTKLPQNVGECAEIAKQDVERGELERRGFWIEKESGNSLVVRLAYPGSLQTLLLTNESRGGTKDRRDRL
jgi:hypothetical protein